MRRSQDLKRLASIVPGVAGDEDMEAIRETDRVVCFRLASDLRECEGDIESVKRYLIEKGDLSLLPELEYLTAKIDRLSSVMKYTGQGGRWGVASYPVNQEELEQLHAFDLALFDELESVRAKVHLLKAAAGDRTALKRSIPSVDQAIDHLEKVFSTRSNVLTLH